MLDWLTWPADQLLRIGGVVAGWFFSKDATSFTVVQMMFATLVLAAFVALLVFWQRLVEYCRSLWKTAAAVATTISPCHTRLIELTVIVKMNFRAIGCG